MTKYSLRPKNESIELTEKIEDNNKIPKKPSTKPTSSPLSAGKKNTGDSNTKLAANPVINAFITVLINPNRSSIDNR